MKRLMIAGLAAATLAASFGGAATAQGYGWNAPHPGAVRERLERLDDRIDWGVRAGRLTAREAVRLRDDLRDVHRLQARFRYDGFSRWELAELDRRLERLSERVRYEVRDPENRREGYGYGWHDGYGHRDGYRPY